MPPAPVPTGTLISVLAGTVVQIQLLNKEIQYNIGGGWNKIEWPVTIARSSLSGTVIVKFISPITLGQYGYFICGSDGITFGDPNDATRAVIRCSGVTNYPGLVANASYKDITICNLSVLSVNSTLSTSGGWIAQGSFGKDVDPSVTTIATITNCGSDGDITSSGGGIIGNACRGVTITACSSSGNISGLNAGGIVGRTSRNVVVSRCETSGSIAGGGGIVGSDPTNVTVSQCYSTGFIDKTASGIIAARASGCTVEKCYSLGAISQDGFGIGSVGATVSTIRNCYSAGTIAEGGIGIAELAWTQENTYAADGEWSDDSADSNLIYTPNPMVETVWSSQQVNTPYILTTSGYSPYSATGAETVFTRTLPIGGGTLPGPVIPGYSGFDILQINDAAPSEYPGITINTVTGIITFDGSVTPGSYEIYVYSEINPYNISQFNVTVGDPEPSTECCAPLLTNIQDQPYETKTDIKIGKIYSIDKKTNPFFRFNSRADYLLWKKAQANA